MRRAFTIFPALFLLISTAVFAQTAELLEQADELHEDEEHREVVDLLEGGLSEARNGAERAEMLWRLSRAALSIGGELEDAGASDDELLAQYEQGESYADDAIEADPENHLGYYWKSANIGRWGQTRGILNALAQAAPMRDLLARAIEIEPNHPDSYYVLGQLYAQVPGFPVSFGDTDQAVSLGRLSVDLMEEELEGGDRDEPAYDFYIQLASHLIDRGWNERRRDRRQGDKRENYQGAESPLERGFFYEGTLDIPAQDDEEEAGDVLDRVISLLESLPSPTEGQEGELEAARELRAGL